MLNNSNDIDIVYGKLYSARISKMFSNEIKKDLKLKNLLLKLEYISKIKKKIRNIFGTDDPNILLTLVGKKINGSDVVIEYEAYTNLRIIVDEYEKIYTECKNRLNVVGSSFDLKKL